MDWTIVGYIGIGGAFAMLCSIGLSSIAPAIRELTAEMRELRRMLGEHQHERLKLKHQINQQAAEAMAKHMVRP